MERELAEQNQELRDTQVMLVQSERMAAIGKQDITPSKFVFSV